MVSGGARKRAGRKARPTSKAKGIWCGQITDEQRDFIIQWLSPDDRFQVLMEAANKASSGLSASGAEKPAKVTKSKKAKPAQSR